MAPESPTDAAQGSMQLASYNDEKAQEFRIWLREKARSGVVFGANGVRECSFVPKEDIEKYFDIGTDRDLWKVDALLKAARRNHPHNVHPDDVARDCPRVFSILIRIGYQQFIHEFVSKDQLHDHALPFTPDKETLFPKLEGGRTFFKAF